MSCNLVWNRPRDFTIKRARSKFLTFESQAWSQTKFAQYEKDYHCPNKGIFLFSTKLYLSSTKIVCNMLQDFLNGLFVFRFPLIWLATLKEPWNLIGCFFLVWISLNITFVPTEFPNSSNAQVCPLQWLPASMVTND